MTNVVWYKTNDLQNPWINLLSLDLGSDYFSNLEGVYVIWKHSNEYPNTVRVGQGIIRDRLQEHKDNSEITQKAINNRLLVTWASVGSGNIRNGIEKYLADSLNPIVGERFPDIVSEVVNLPA